MIKRLFSLVWGKRLIGYKLVKVCGWDSALVERQGIRQRVWFAVVFALAASLSSCASQNAYRDKDGRWAYGSNELFHRSKSSAQIVGVGTVSVREYDEKTGKLVSTYEINSTSQDSLISVRSQPDGIEAVKLWGLLSLGSDLVSGANNVAQDAVNQ